MNPELLRRVPQLERLIQSLGAGAGLPRALVTEIARRELASMRQEAQAGAVLPDFEGCVIRVRERVELVARSRIQPVINGTGILIHTNLGRSPLSLAAADAVREIGNRYSNVELDLETGERGKRGRFLELALAAACQAESATVVNNCAGALVLILRHLAGHGDKREVIISRGQLVEIGGGFRVPDIMETSGARLREVGTTNRTSLEDYRRAIGPNTAMLLRVHRSNFYMEGFVEEPTLEALAALGREHGIPVVEDLGSGALARTETLTDIDHEPSPQEMLEQGADLVCFSGDKLFGGPQAGIIIGRPDLVSGLKADPFFRALRCDKLILSALQETVLAYLDQKGGSGTLGDAPLPVLEMLRLSQATLHERAQKIVHALADSSSLVQIGTGISRCGGGTMPKSAIPSVTLDVRPQHISLEKFAAKLRDASPPIIGYTSENCLKIDLRTVFSDQDALLIEGLRRELYY